jgi:hypothetical protein
MKCFALVAGAAVLSVPAIAQDAASSPEPMEIYNTSSAMPMQVQPVAAQPSVVLPANTEILLRTNQEVTTKGKTWSEGDSFDLSVVHDVTLGNYVVIPRGSKGTGKITWLTSKGAFGKSGKMDIELQYVEVAGRRINIDGTYRQEGEGNTVATIGGVLLAGVFAGFVTGKSGRIPQGRELMAHTENDIPLAIPASAVPSVTQGLAVQPVNAATVPTEKPAP